ncbi:DUF3108 domain-containing protein [Burkholderia ubonensis]|uniref:DUF3108 domain-containing protein n=1 Tax=Burkholderia ubonensis TaxID=101571 RepID=UPI00075ACF25|nr:DUF3108 domain-containing protein [Burkholderia ubonensis]KVP42504.1 hypothetical protein WJ89_01625 [Burkholderia ubonensis]KVQ84085.1 hypothetical protein WK06_09265 [Burkholderia ubonensis]KVR09554.1 hypothetical protein WK12_02550 [Burkholderia ubonensis]KWD35175.1 hypothetical protein WL63_16140 [Burkholderia ubonensis]KWD46630.1 hypothetical protein WL64_02675 [Burkholderia ubonensis]
MPPSDARPRYAPPRRWLRAGVALVVVLVLHALAALWFMRHREPFTPPAPAEVPVQIELLKPRPIERQPAQPAPKPAARPAAPAPAAPKPAKPAAAPSRPAPQEPQEPVLTSTQTATEGVPAAASAGGTASGASAAAAGGASGAATAGPASNGVKFAAPPSGDLQYDAFFNGMQNSTGTIHWRTDGQTYELSVTMPVPFIGPFRYRSQGRVDAYGIAPDRYVEQRGKRPEDIAIFNREIRQVVFTRTPDNAPLPDGTQDRFSMLMQLSGLVRGNPDAYRRGVTQQFFVIDNNSGETWPITVIGDEPVQTAAGFIETRHFMRLPRRAGDTRRIDMWLAPSLGWLPARLVQTEPNGAQIELLWHGPLAAPAVPAEAAPDTGGTPNAASDAAAPGMPNAPPSAASSPPAAP